MNIKQLLQEIEDGKWEEIDKPEFMRLDYKLCIYLNIQGNFQYFKRKEVKPEIKFPIVFENEWYTIKVFGDKIEIDDNEDGDVIVMNSILSLPLLIQAVDKWKELQGDKK